MRTGRPTEKNHTPLQLHALLRRHNISQGDLCRAMTYQSGKRAGQSLSTSTVSTLLTQQRWPRTVDFYALKAQVATFLRARAVPENEIATAWNYEGSAAAPAPPPAHTYIGALNPHANQAAPGSHHEPFDLPEIEMLSQAAREHFQLVRHPFLDDVQGPQDVYLSKNQRYIRESMYYAAKHGGFVAVVGESGSGKSTLRRDLVERIKRDAEAIVVIQPQTIDKKSLTAAHICDAIIADLSTESPKQSLEAKARQIQRILSASARTGTSHVLMIEEAHDLSLATLKYLKRFWEMEDGFKKLLGIILVGQPELGDRLDERRNYDAREVIQRCEIARLAPLNGNLEEYLALKLKRVGLTLDQVFTKDAYDAMRARLTRRRPGSNESESSLYPLRVQNLIVKCMNQAVEIGLEKIDGDLVGRV